MNQKLTLKDEKSEPVDKYIRINVSTLKEEMNSYNLYNPILNLELKDFKRHHSLVPIKKDNSKILQKSEKIKVKKSIEIELMNQKEKENKFEQEVSDIQNKKVKENEEKKPIENKNSCYKSSEKFIDSSPVVVIMTLFTIFALFGSDIKSVWLTSDVDIYFDGVECALIFFFTLEILIASIVKKDYLWSFFFWLDVISTLSILQDISFFFDYLLTGYSSINPYVAVTNTTITNGSFGNIKANMHQATNAISKVSSASRATRVLRIIRIIRLIRIVKLYKSAVMARNIMEKRKKEKERIEAYKAEMESSSNSDISSLRADGGNLYINSENNQEYLESRRDSESHNRLTFAKNNKDEPMLRSKRLSQINLYSRQPQSKLEVEKEKKKNKLKVRKYVMPEEPTDEVISELKISKVLTESITKKVILLILCMLVIIPILSDDFYSDSSLVSYSILAKYISNYFTIDGDAYFDFENPYNTTKILGKIFTNSIDPSFPIVAIELDGGLLYRNESWADYNFRSSEINSAISSDGLVEVKYSVLTETIYTGGFNIGRTIFVCICLTLAAIYFENDTQQLVLQPLEIMIEIVDSVAKDPINAKNVENLKKGMKSTMMKIDKGRKVGKEKLTEEKYEIKIIESAIIKISALLAIGFGEAGGEIIKENLTSGSELNPMLKGKKKTAIFGFCDIRNFPEVNEVLQERSMVFVNEIAEIVHSSVDKYGGAANKNIGDAFLMVWKFKREGELVDPTSPQKKQTVKDNLLEEDPLNPVIQRTADMAVLGFLTVIIRINKNLRVLAYRNDPEISSKLKNYKVKMGFGLHMGWAIEGAIGSSYKIDASYLSPNVNMAARLEAATKIYGVSILISGSLYDQLSENIKLICRLVDRVTVKGSIEPVRLYTIDLNLNLTPQKKKKKKLSAKAQRDKYISKKNKILNNAKLTGGVAHHALNKNSFREALYTGRGLDFYNTWSVALEDYFAGKWEDAAKKFTECLNLVDSDGPSKTLLAYLKSHNYIPPSNWKGVRELTSKT